MDAPGGSGSILLVSEAGGELDPVNGGEERSQGYRQMIGCTQMRGFGIEPKPTPCPGHLAQSPLRWGQLDL